MDIHYLGAEWYPLSGEKIENNKPEYNLSLLFNKSYLNMIIIYNILTISSNTNIYK